MSLPGQERLKQLAGKVREGADGRVRACRSFFRAYGHYPVESGRALAQPNMVTPADYSHYPVESGACRGV